MSDNNVSLDQNTIEFLTNFYGDLVKGIIVKFEDRINSIEKSIESIEKQVATLVLGYGEQAVFMEALVAQMAFATDDARKTFHQDLANARKQMLEVMQDASRGFLADEDQNLATAITDLVAEKLSDSGS